MFIPDSNVFVKETAVLKIWEEILKHYQRFKDDRFVALSHNFVGFSRFMLHDYAKSIEELLKADAIFRKVGYASFPEISNHLHNITLVFYFFRQYGK